MRRHKKRSLGTAKKKRKASKTHKSYGKKSFLGEVSAKIVDGAKDALLVAAPHIGAALVGRAASALLKKRDV